MSNRDKKMAENGGDRLQGVIDSQPGATVSHAKQRGVITFDLQSKPEFPSWREMVRVNVYPQDPFVNEPVLRLMPASELREGVVNQRFRVRDSRRIVAKADARGDYIFPTTKREFDQINAIYYGTLALRMCEQYAGRPLPWSFGMDQLLLDPCVGTSQANAFYNESERLVGFFTYKRGKDEIRAAQSADIIAHEVGHAILDGLRDLLNVSFSFGPEAFHESFCDFIAILVALHDNGLIERLIAVTGGNLETQNFVSTLAEELGTLRNSMDDDPRNDSAFYLRNALNDFKAQPFKKLPYLPQDRVTGLGREAHSYSRVYTGALYSILIEIYKLFQREKWAKQVALAMARDVVGELLIRSVELGPIGECSLEDFAWTMLVADTIFLDGRYRRILEREFIRRKILTRALIGQYAARAADVPDLKIQDGLNDPEAAQRFLESHRKALKLPKDMQFYIQSGYRDRQGNRFITYFCTHPIHLDHARYKQYAGYTVPLFGGVVMMFDPNGVLRHFLFRPVEEEDVQQAMVQIADMVENRHLAFSALEGASPLGLAESSVIVTVGTDRKPPNALFEKVAPEFTPAKKGGMIPVLDAAMEVIRISMQVIDQPKIEDFAATWTKKLKLDMSGK